MGLELFRREAIDHVRHRLTGEVTIGRPVSERLLALILVLVALAIGLFLVAGRYEQRESVRGWIVPERGLIRVVARQGGVVTKTFAQQGRRVERNQPLVLIEDPRQGTVGSIAILRERNFDAEARAVDEKARADDMTLDVQRAALASQRVAADGDLRRAQARVQLAQRQLEIRKKIYNDQKTLVDRGFAAPSRLQNSEADVLQAQAGVVSAEADSASAIKSIESIDYQISRLGVARRAQVADRARAFAVLDERKTDAEFALANLNVAPVSGTITYFGAEEGQTVNSGDVLAYLTPENSPLIVELYVPSKSVGLLRIGQPVTLKYDAFPFQTYGTGLARIESISQSPMPADAAAKPSGLPSESLFRVRAKLLNPFVNLPKSRLALTPGMALDGQILLEDRSFFQWLFAPLLATRNHVHG